MFRSTLLLAIFSLVYSGGPIEEKIVGGEEVDIRQFPYQVSLETHGIHNCGGALVKANVIVTAAHCTNNYLSLLEFLSVRAGTSEAKHKDHYEVGGEVAKVVKIHQHPKYRSNPTDYDVSVVILDRDLPLSEFIQPIQLLSKNYLLATGRLGTVTGWGAIRYWGELSDILRAVEVPKVDRVECSIVYDGRISSRMACYGYKEGGKDACQGDSGGPLVHYIDGVPYLSSLVSWGKGCATPGYPGVYADLQHPTIYDYVIEHAGL